MNQQEVGVVVVNDDGSTGTVTAVERCKHQPCSGRTLVIKPDGVGTTSSSRICTTVLCATSVPRRYAFIPWQK